jgi:hypothetical protein
MVVVVRSGDGPRHVRISFFFGRLSDMRHTGQIESNYDETTDSFDSMNLKAELLRGVYAYGYADPTLTYMQATM